LLASNALFSVVIFESASADAVGSLGDSLVSVRSSLAYKVGGNKKSQLVKLTRRTKSAGGTRVTRSVNNTTDGTSKGGRNLALRAGGKSMGLRQGNSPEVGAFHELFSLSTLLPWHRQSLSLLAKTRPKSSSPVALYSKLQGAPRGVCRSVRRDSMHSSA
jgi:hypothetical protein